MSVKIEATTLAHENFIDSASRYNSSDIIYWGNKNIITFTTYKRPTLPDTPDDRYYVITAGTQYRPDLVSFRAYGDPRYWWRIMEANKIFDVMDFKIGKNIVIPSLLR